MSKAQEEELDAMLKLWQGDLGTIYDGDIYVAQKLMFHYALLVNPSYHGHEHRYCYKDLPLIEVALKELRQTGKLRYWHKDHTKGLSVKDGLLFPNGAFQDDPNEAVGEVNW